MATTALSPELASMAAFRDVLARDIDRAALREIADQLCVIGQYRLLRRSNELPVDTHDDRLVFIASGAAKMIAQLGLPPSGPSTAEHGHSVRRDQLRPATPVLAFHFPGDLVSVPQTSGGDFRLAALRDTDVIVFRAEPFLDIAQGDPAIIRCVLVRSLHALQRSRTRMMQLGHKPAAARIADFLVSMAHRVCGCSCGECTFDLPMSRRDIGDSLGLTIETVSRQLAELRAQGLIETHGRSGIRLCDMAALARRGGLLS